MQIRQEINILNSQLTNLTGAGLSSETSQLDTTQYNGTVTYYLEVVAKNTNVSASRQATLSISGDGVTIPANTSSFTLFRGPAFTPNTGTTSLQLAFSVNTSPVDTTVKSARLIIIQNATTLTNTETQIEIGNASSTTALTDTALTNPKYWQYTSANWDGTITAYFEGTFLTGTSKSAATMTLQTSTGIAAPSWSNVTGTAVTTTSATAARVRSTAFTLVAGNWYRVVMKAGNSKSGITVYNAKVIIDQSNSPTKLEPQYLLANTLLAAGTALQTFLTKWDSTEWSGVTNTYTGQAEGPDNGTSVILITDAAGSTTVATITSPDNAGTGVATMPANGNLDTKATTNNGNIAAVRILVATVVVAAVSTNSKFFNFLYNFN